MAISDSVQTLTAAFSFGILFTAASGALFIYYNGHGSTILQDGRRLVLALFLFFAAMWAQVDFMNLLVTSSAACQVSLVFSTVSDQISRVAMEQFLLWSIGNGSTVTVQVMILQAMLAIRLVAGGILVGFTRPDFAPACVARTSLMPISIVVLSLDLFIIGALLLQSLGKPREPTSRISSSQSEHKKAVICILVGFLLWTGASVMMILGMRNTLLILRTFLPSLGLVILVGLVAIFSRTLLSHVEKLTTPEATSPFISGGPLHRDVFAGTGSPMVGHNYSKSGNLFVVNPSDTPRLSPNTSQSNVFQQGDAQGFAKVGTETTIRAMGSNEQDLPQPKNGPGYRGSSGVFPSGWAPSMTSAVQGTMAPQIKLTATDNSRSMTFPAPAIQQKRSLFNWSSKPVPQSNVRSLGISKPVMNDIPDTSEQPFPRMQTIDLATAMSNERERREAAAARARLGANQPSTYQSGTSPQEALQKSISIIRKQMPANHVEAMPTIASSGASGLSVEAINANTTSASLSPGREEVRRRSPRNASSFGSLGTVKRPISKPLPFRQVSQTRGLPSNPRSTRLPVAKEQTVMLMNNIVYNDPSTVESIMNGAPAMAKRLKAGDLLPTEPDFTTLKSSTSIIHRPRPYRKDSDKERSIYPSEVSPHHTRSKSGSSIIGRKSIFGSHPGSPTQLPPLPAPPRTASKLTRLLPNDTKSMTFDEKIELLFPAPPGAAYIPYRRSSVPSVPRVPSIFTSDEPPQVQSPSEVDTLSHRTSRRNTLASFTLRETDVPSTRMIEPRDTLQSFGLRKSHIPAVERQETRDTLVSFGLDASHIPVVERNLDSVHPSKAPENSTASVSRPRRNTADEIGETWIPGIPLDDVNDINLRRSTLRKAENIIQKYERRKSAFTEWGSSDVDSRDSATFWGSIHSEAPAIDLSKALRNASSIQLRDIVKQSNNPRALPPLPPLPSSMDSNAEIVTVKLDLGGNRGPTARTTEPTWHRRIGDVLPTFSERQQSTRTRKMPPPIPLLLNSKGRAKNVVVQIAEPSPPPDYPEKALAEIQAQLQRFEEPSRGSVGSLLRLIPDHTVDAKGNESNGHDNRLKLLENLELEMGQQENHWQQMHTNFDRLSMSTTLSPSSTSENGGSRPSSQISSRPTSRIFGRRAHVRSSMSQSNGEGTNSTASTQSSDNSRASVWQQRLAEAQIEYLENAPTLLRKKSVNFLSVSNIRLTSLGSPTPPESLGSGSDAESETDFRAIASRHTSTKKYFVPASLWQPALPSPKAGVGRMWTPPYENLVRPASPEPPAKNIRPAHRTITSELSLSSSSLWSRPATLAYNRPVVGLWGSKPARTKTFQTRRITKRPERKSKRITFLPDILESPQPLPFKRDTLGIFQFPWGETSDSAVFQPTFIPTITAIPVTNAKLEARSRELELEEYSSSFFDDYDEEDMVDEESDDDFDETTLWEIASLLKSSDVPSKESLLPTAGWMTEDREAEDESDYVSHGRDATVGESFAPTSLPIQPLVRKATPKVEPKLWTTADLTVNSTEFGLPQPEQRMWENYTRICVHAPRSQGRLVTELPKLDSNKLWTSTKASASPVTTHFLWCGKSGQGTVAKLPTTELLSSTVYVAPKQSKGMWEQRSRRVSTQLTKLFSVGNIRTTFRTTEAIQKSATLSKVSRPSPAAALSISSTRLWAPEQSPKRTVDWIRGTTPTSEVVPSSNLWTAPKRDHVNNISGLFEKSPQRLVYRTTNLPPASLNMPRTTRTKTCPLSQLTSNELWSANVNIEPEHHWITESSVRCESPSIYSESSSGQSSPYSETASLKSSSTKASSLWGSFTSASALAWWDSKSSKKSGTTSPTETPKGSRIPTRKHPISTKPLESVRESRVLAYSDLWEATSPALEKAPAPKLHKTESSSSIPNLAQKPSPQPQDYLPRLVRPTATVSDWNTALSTAIVKGLPHLSRPACSPPMWDAALSQAISASHPRLQRPYCTPNMWESALNEAMFVDSKNDGMWASRARDDEIIPEHTTSGALMWSGSAKRASLFSHSSQTTLRKAPVSIVSSLAVLQSTNLWESNKILVSEGNWLTTLGITPNHAASPVGSMASQQLWVVPVTKIGRQEPLYTIASVSGADMFAHLEQSYNRRAPVVRPAVLSNLQSTELFKLPNSMEQIHWLHASSISRQVDAKAAPSKHLTWVAQDPAPKRTDAFTVAPSSSLDMFASVPLSSTRNNSPRTFGLLSLTSNKLFTPSAKPATSVNWLQNCSIVSESSNMAYTWTAPTKPAARLPAQMWTLSPQTISTSPMFADPHAAPWSRTKREMEPLQDIETKQLWRADYSIPTSPMHWLVKRNKHFSGVEFRY